MPKRRWRLGGYELKYNPKSADKRKNSTGDVRMTANGLVSSNNLYYEEDIQFTFDIYEKPTTFHDPISTYTNFYYVSATEDEANGNLTVLRRGTNLYDVISKSGTLLENAKSVNLSSGSIVSSIARIDTSRIACIFPSGDFVICGDNGVQISKYNYTDQDVRDSVSIAWDKGNFVYLLNKYGKIFKVNKANGVLTTEFTFSDFAANKASLKAIYSGIHFGKDGYLGFIIGGKKIVYMDSQFNVAHSIELQSTITSVSYGFFSGSFFITGATQLIRMVPNLSTMEVEKVKAQLANGAVMLFDENNISHALFIQQMNIKRIRNLQDSRYEITIAGRIS